MTQAPTAETDRHPYTRLTPELILDAVETYGLHCTGALLALNSYENRVYRVDTVEQGAVAAKFYRPARWTEDAIREEHEFIRLLAEHEIPAVAPMDGPAGSLNIHENFFFAVFPWQPGRASELNHPDERVMLGRYFGRLHRLGRTENFHHRPVITVETRGEEPVEFLLSHDFVPDYLRPAYEAITQQLLPTIARAFAAADAHYLRVHGDAHLGNILWAETRPHIVDFDDCCMAPAVQDLWMFLSGERAERTRQLDDLLEGYTEFMEFDAAELRLIEPLRTLRMLHYSAWLARRWDDPAFPRAFPWFNNQRYWEEQLLALREQQALLDEPPLAWGAY